MNSLNSSKFSCCANVINCSPCLQTFQPPKLCGELRGRCVSNCVPEQRIFLLTTSEPELMGTQENAECNPFVQVSICLPLLEFNVLHVTESSLSLSRNESVLR